ncbi:hypothetical protein [Paraburkholderia nemoris]|uniref:Uncharacterized protein n=2 Tax=Paraburkholderia TaxID=1822464 RepID=A0ABM8T7T3_9BURK|nr:hypothetical protein [Paraburkholderia nemoris]MBK3816459.1 hypothetical protein [Paraburkholderia aspalathi]MBK5184375.1 hypothetical protein [Burkholderia sp. R-69749]CAE6872286.1 hypothetical protein R69749_06312 [Paraburkholderia domus]CAE6858135.1 hypothetical protein R75777_07899 [Paraburkholderia nemoris]CAE6862463.1 hypothetical protein R69776_08082 [Paraburkholderia nemoris]
MSRIHTLNARGNVMLAAIRNYYSWTDEQTFKEVQRFHQDFLQILSGKGISYDELRTALTPQTIKHEAAFLFDEDRCNPDCIAPGVDAADALFKLLPAKTTHSILGGELIGDDKDEIARRLLAEKAVVAKDLNFKHPCFCYVLYVNNLSSETLVAIHEGLNAHSGYLGYVPCTYASLTKTFVTMGLVNLAIKRRNIVILGHEDDRPNTENCNLHLHDYTALGLEIRSVQSMYFGVFLSYKPEQLLLQETDDDLEIAIRAMSKEAAPLIDCTVLIEDKKFEYLTTAKDGKLALAGVGHMTKNELEEAIRFKVRSNYLYSLDWRDVPATAESAGYRGSYFNIMLEFPREGGEPERVTVALEFMPAGKVLRVVTMT